MRRLLALLVAASFGFVNASAGAQEGDRALLSSPALRIGEQATLVIEVTTEPGVVVEIDPAAPSWNGVVVVRLAESTVAAEGAAERHRLQLVVAPFTPGSIAFAPAVNLVRDGLVSPRVLPELSVEVLESLAPDAPLEISPLAPPRSIAGAESPFLRPAIALGGLLAAAVVVTLGWFAVRWYRRRPKPVIAAPEPAGFAPLTGITDAERALDSDPVRAYRAMGQTVRLALSREYGLAATSMTTAEIRGRLEAHGVDRWVARLTAGLLEECDAVVYAGYRPAAERRRHDLNMAREIVGEAG